MGGDLFGGILSFLTFLAVLGGGFFLIYGLWEVAVKRFEFFSVIPEERLEVVETNKDTHFSKHSQALLELWSVRFVERLS